MKRLFCLLFLAAIFAGPAILRAQPTTQPAAVWTPATVLKPGGVYYVTGGVSIPITADDTTFIGIGPVWPVNGPALNVKADRVTIRGIVFDYPKATGTGRLGLKPCIRDTGEGTTVIDCAADSVDTFLEALPGSEGLTLLRCRTTNDLRGGAVYCGGANNVSLIDCRPLIARNENTVRWSPQGADIAQKALIRRCTIVNTGRKAAVEFRHVKGAAVEDSTLQATLNNSAVGIGDKDTADGEFGAESIRVAGNVITGGSITVHAGARYVDIVGNLAQWPTFDPKGNTFITANGSQGTLHDLTIRDNHGESPVGQKALVGYQDAGKIAGLIDVGNGWSVTPTSHPTTRPGQ